MAFHSSSCSGSTRRGCSIGAALLLAVASDGTAWELTTCYPSLKAGKFTSVCNAELVDASEYQADGKTLRNYEVKGTCSIGGMEHCLYVEFKDDEYDKEQWNQAFQKAFVFSKAILTWDPQANVARVQGYLVGDNDTTLLGSAEFPSNFMDMTYQCGTDPFLSPLVGCQPLGAGLSQYYQDHSCPAGGEALCPPFASEVPKAEVEALIQQKLAAQAASTPKPVAVAQSVSGAVSKPVPGALVLPGITLELLGAQPTVDPACTSAAAVLTVAVTVRNGMLPVAENLGTVAVSETGGAKLSSGRIGLPAFGTGQTRVITVPVSAVFSPAQTLPGAHQLLVELQPKTANDEETFSAKPKSLPLSVTLPAGICEQTLASAKRSTSSVQRQVSPQVLAQPARQATPAQREPAQTRQLSAASAAAEPAPAAMFSVEAEQLAQAGKILVNGGRVDVQDMAAFGSGWSGNAQLFWTGGAVGGVLDLLVDVPVAATYTLEIYLTRAPDYADLSIEVDGTPSPVEFSAFAAGVMAPGPTQAGKFSLQPGPRKVSLMITGKYPQSTGYFVGIDRVVLYPAGAP